MISAWALCNQFILAQLKIDEKLNEIIDISSCIIIIERLYKAFNLYFFTCVDPGYY